MELSQDIKVGDLIEIRFCDKEVKVEEYNNIIIYNYLMQKEILI